MTDVINSEQAKERVAWVDYGRGVDVLVIVFSHSGLGAAYQYLHSPFFDQLNLQLSLTRTPILFLLSGLFCSSLINNAGLSEFLNKRVLNFAYLYFIWSIINFVGNTYLGGQLGYQVGFEMWQPEGLLRGESTTLWFLYSLALMGVIARLTRNFPKVIVLSFFVLFHIYSLHDHFLFHFDNTFVRTLRFYIFFLIGVLFYKEILKKTSPKLLMAVMAMILFLVLSYYGSLSKSYTSTLMALVAEAAGIFGTLELCRYFATKNLFSIFKWLGKNSLIIFVSHRLFWFWSIATGFYIKTQWQEINIILLCVFSTLFSLGFSYVLKKYNINFLINLPKRLQLK